MKNIKKINCFCAVLWAVLLMSGCSSRAPKSQTAVDAGGLKLTRAVLYQNGVGYFERRGTVEGDSFSVRIRADQVNDFLKSLTVIDTSDAKAVSVSLPLDRSAAARVMELAQQLKEDISLPEIISLLKGTEVTLNTSSRGVSGRVLSVEPWGAADAEEELSLDWRVSVMADNEIQTLLLSEVTGLYINDSFITLGLHKGLDAAATGGVFKVVDVVIRLDKNQSHEILVSYVVECPAWKPTYRLVIGDEGDVLLQGWAVVDNVTGEGWDNISLSLTSGAPLAFEYDLYSPRFVGRPDLSAATAQKVVRAAIGETSYGALKKKSVASDQSGMLMQDEEVMDISEKEIVAEHEKLHPPVANKASPRSIHSGMGGGGGYARPSGATSRNVSTIETLQSSVQSMVKASSASGAVRYDMTQPVSIPDRSSTLVSILNHKVKGEEAFLFKPGGGGQGYEQNPYRVVRFENNTGFILEPGPVSIYSGGSFVGEGIIDTVSDGRPAVIPFAVDASVLVTSKRKTLREGARLVRIFNRQLWVESFSRIKTEYQIKGCPKSGCRVYVRHAKAGGSFEFKDVPKETEEVGNAYLIPVDVKSDAKQAVYTAVEQTPVTRTLAIWNKDALSAVSLILQDPDELDAKTKEKLAEVLEIVTNVSQIDSNLSHLRKKRDEIDGRMEQTRENLKALKKNKSAEKLKGRLAKSLETLAKDAAGVTAEIVSLTDERSVLVVSADQLLGQISFDDKE